MAERKSRYKAVEKYLSIAIIADTLFFLAYLIFAGIGASGGKIVFAILCLLISVAIVGYLYMIKEIGRPRSLWMALASAAIVLCLLLSLVLNFPSPSPRKAPASAGITASEMQ